MAFPKLAPSRGTYVSSPPVPEVMFPRRSVVAVKIALNIPVFGLIRYEVAGGKYQYSMERVR